MSAHVVSDIQTGAEGERLYSMSDKTQLQMLYTGIASETSL